MRLPGATLRRTAERLLLLEGPAVAESAVEVCEKLSRRLAPLVGEAGVKALVSRSLRLAMSHAQASAPAAEAPPAAQPDKPPEAPPDEPIPRLRAWLRRQDDVAGTASAVTLLAFLLQLLTTFIGGALTAKVLQGAWPDLATDELEEPEEPMEIKE